MKRDYSLTLSLIALTGSLSFIIYQNFISKYINNKKENQNQHHDNIIQQNKIINKNISAYESLIGNTPLVYLKKLSDLVGHDIYIKMENYNPAGSGKDRAVYYILKKSMEAGLLKKGMKIVEGTSGSTGIALAHQCLALGLMYDEDKKYDIKKEDNNKKDENLIHEIKNNKNESNLYIVMPDDQADEKKNLLRFLQASLHIVPTCSITNPNHYVNVAKRIVSEGNKKNLLNNEIIKDNNNENNFKDEYNEEEEEEEENDEELNYFFVNQFENLLNSRVHYETTGPEIYKQLNGNINGFIMSSGTGGTISGVSNYLKEKTNDSCYVILADPIGSSLCNHVNYGVCYTEQQKERGIKKHRYDSIVEGVGLDRLTNNFIQAKINESLKINDEQILAMAYYILYEEGILIGSSTALNLYAVYKACKLGKFETEQEKLDRINEENQLKINSLNGKIDTNLLTKRKQIVTINCDFGMRHLSRLYNPKYLYDNYQLKSPSYPVNLEDYL